MAVPLIIITNRRPFVDVHHPFGDDKSMPVWSKYYPFGDDDLRSLV